MNKNKKVMRFESTRGSKSLKINKMCFISWNSFITPFPLHFKDDFLELDKALS
jgi:hypothetical protein